MEAILKRKKNPLVNSGMFKDFIGQEPEHSFELTVPVDYFHWKQLTHFYAQNVLAKRNFVIFADTIVDKNYCMSTNRLLPGETYNVDLYPLLRKTKGNLCFLFMEHKESLFPGPQFLSLAWDINKDFFPKDMSVAIFDHRTALYRSPKFGHQVPFIHRDEKGLYWSFSTEDLGKNYDNGFLIPVIKKKTQVFID